MVKLAESIKAVLYILLIAVLIIIIAGCKKSDSNIGKGGDIVKIDSILYSGALLSDSIGLSNISDIEIGIDTVGEKVYNIYELEVLPTISGFEVEYPKGIELGIKGTIYISILISNTNSIKSIEVIKETNLGEEFSEVVKQAAYRSVVRSGEVKGGTKVYSKLVIPVTFN